MVEQAAQQAAASLSLGPGAEIVAELIERLAALGHALLLRGKPDASLGLRHHRLGDALPQLTAMGLLPSDTAERCKQVRVSEPLLMGMRSSCGAVVFSTCHGLQCGAPRVTGTPRSVEKQAVDVEEPLLAGAAEAASISAPRGFRAEAEIFVPLVELRRQFAEFLGVPHRPLKPLTPELDVGSMFKGFAATAATMASSAPPASAPSPAECKQS
ncbi:unnamed protein product [Prorocentrum cordatum]|uniref:Uncharacterized protein n=1 Tax=Prorocentrum cordatum TaxID=2364126 RepID=A0ABN9TI91_9DINO|nr:unnamed protein product [Polarella glacialis]